MGDGLDIRRSSRFAPPGIQPVGRGALGLARLGEMVGQDFRLAVGPVARSRFSIAAAMRPCRAWRGPRSSVRVGGVLHERVLELVVGGGRGAALEHQAGGDELVECAARVGLAARRRRGDQARRKSRGRSRSPVCAISRATGPSRSSRAISDACRSPARRAGRRRCAARDAAVPRAVPPASSTTLVTSSRKSGTPSVRSRISSMMSGTSGAGGERPHQRLAVASAEPRQGHRRDAPGRPARLELGPERRDQQHRQAVDARDRAVQQFARGRVHPVKILEHHQHRPAPREVFEQPHQRVEHLLLAALRRQLLNAIAPRRRAPTAGRRTTAAPPRRAAGQHGLELAPPVWASSFAVEAGGAFELADDRVERAFAMMRRAEIAQVTMRLVGDALAHALRPGATCRGPARPRSARRGLGRIWPRPAAHQQLDLRRRGRPAAWRSSAAP